MAVRVNDNAEELKVGQLVTTDYHSRETAVVRKIEKIVRDRGYGSGYKARADGGSVCPHCKMVGTPVPIEFMSYVDAAWFIPCGGIDK